MGGQPAAAVDSQGVDAHPIPSGRVAVDLQLDLLPGPDLRRGDGVAAGFEGNQAVFPDPPQMLLRDQIRLVWQGPQRGPVSLSPDGDDLPVGAVHLGSADRQPGRERAVQLGNAVEAPAGDHMVPDDVDLPLDPTFPSRPVGGQHVDGAAVMVGRGPLNRYGGE